ncbi:MAG: transcriptional regulator, partial [Anaerolineae bacterium]|nr:transcriptional regulator [Anaerolineae bacterium]
KMLPPLIFHTLIENGISHSYQKKTNGNFKIEFLQENNVDIYRITNDGGNKIPQELKDGLGFKYIKSRLEEAFPNAWEFNCHYENEEWISEIRIKL